jgi:hypothetical protein
VWVCVCVLCSGFGAGCGGGRRPRGARRAESRGGQRPRMADPPWRPRRGGRCGARRPPPTNSRRRTRRRSRNPPLPPGAQDERWAERQRAGRATDAILSCPGCFTTVCLECQQHAELHTQYRALFTVNCAVRADAPMAVRGARGGGAAGSRKRKGPGAGPGGEGEDGAGGGAPAEVMLPVVCEVCGTQVGAQDADEVVHFYHVLASNA